MSPRRCCGSCCKRPSLAGTSSTLRADSQSLFRELSRRLPTHRRFAQPPTGSPDTHIAWHTLTRAQSAEHAQQMEAYMDTRAKRNA